MSKGTIERFIVYYVFIVKDYNIFQKKRATLIMMALLDCKNKRN
jgi:hypothetical protein